MTLILKMLAGGVSLFAIIDSIVVIKAHRRLPLKATWTMISLALQGSKAFPLIAGVILVAHAAYPEFLSDWIPPFPPLLVYTVCGFAIFQICLPPSILVLGASRQTLRSFLVKLSTSPLRIVHLVDSPSVEEYLSAESAVAREFRENRIRSDQYRVGPNWHRAIERLSNIVPVIILDGRMPSSAVTRELTLIREDPDRKGRTFVITTGDGRIPAGQISFGFQSFRIATEETLATAMSFAARSFLFCKAKSLAQHIENRIKLPLTPDELRYVETLRDIGAIEEVIPYELRQYRYGGKIVL